jgi:aryl-alcohol dehydrogenase-like predicted oxidoreductase
MDRVRLGMTELRVTPICFGTWQLGGDWGDYDEEQAARAIRAALERQINFFDTAQAYGFGRSEHVLGRALGPELRGERDSLVIATKGGLRTGPGGGVERDSRPEWIREGVERSLRELGVDHIDLYQIHWPDPETPFAETATALARLLDEGKIRHVGVSNFDASQMRELAATLPVETLQPPYHLFRREIEDEVLPYCAEHDIGVLAYGPLAHGLLTGALDEEVELAPDDWRTGSPMFTGEAYRRNLERVRELKRLAAERDLDVAQLAIAWVLANRAVQVAIVGTRSSDHIAAAAAAASVELSEDELQRIDRIMWEAVRVPGPSPEM